MRFFWNDVSLWDVGVGFDGVDGMSMGLLITR